MGCCQDAVDTTFDTHNSHITTCATKIGHNRNLIFRFLDAALVVCEECGDGLVDVLEDFNTGLLCGFGEGGLLRVCEVGGDGDDGCCD